MFIMIVMISRKKLNIFVYLKICAFGRKTNAASVLNSMLMMIFICGFTKIDHEIRVRATAASSPPLFQISQVCTAHYVESQFTGNLVLQRVVSLYFTLPKKMCVSPTQPILQFTWRAFGMRCVRVFLGYGVWAG